MDNPLLSECYVYDGITFPFEADKFKVIIADYVMEHVELPAEMFSEISRVLMPGGVFIFRTPNTRHYVSAIAHWTPHWFHLKVANWSRGYPDKELEPYPTIYKSNNEKDIKALCKKSFLEITELHYVEKQPSYLMFNGFIFFFGIIYERVVNKFSFLRKFRANLFCIVKST
jgi:SAM-dependent methyltransferase